MPRRVVAPAATAAANRPALGAIDTNTVQQQEQLGKAAGKAVKSTDAKKRGKDELLNDLKSREQENLALRNKASELEEQLQTLTDKLKSVDISAKGPTKRVPEANVIPLPLAPAVQAPRRPVSAYVHFCNESREMVKQSNPNASATEIMKVCATMWKELDPTGTQMHRYAVLARQDRERHDREMETYRAKISGYEEECKAIEYYNQQLKTQRALNLYDETLKAKSNKSSSAAAAATVAAVSAAVDPAPSNPKTALQEPKKPMSAFVVFQAEKRKEIKKKNPTIDNAELSKAVGEEWSKLQHKKSGMKKYTAAAEKDKRRYESEHAEYEAKKAEEKKTEQERAKAEYDVLRQKALTAYRQKLESDAAVDLYKKNKAAETLRLKEERMRLREEKQRKQEEKDKMPKRNISAYFFFSNEVREKVRAQMMAQRPQGTAAPSAAEVSIELGKLWATRTEPQKERYHHLAAQDKARYDAEMASFKQSQP